MRLFKKLISEEKIRKLRNWAEKSSLPGFEGVALWDVGRLLYFELLYGNLAVRASAMAFSFFVALFPAMITLITVIPYIPIQGFDTILYNYIFEFLPAEADVWVGSTINDLSRIPRGGLLSVSFALMVIFASNGVAMMMTGFEKSFDASFKNRNFIQYRFTALWLTLLLFLSLIVAVILFISSNFIFDYIITFVLHAQPLSRMVIVLNFILSVFVFYSLIAIIYQYAPAFRIKPGYFSPGAVLATFLFVLISAGFAFFLNNFASYNKIYGSIGAVIVLLIWIELNCFILLIGFEINASIALNRDMGSITDFDSYLAYRLGDDKKN